MDKDEAIAWVTGKRSSVNYMPQELIAETDAFMTQQAYWILKAYKEQLIEEPKP